MSELEDKIINKLIMNPTITAAEGIDIRTLVNWFPQDERQEVEKTIKAMASNPKGPLEKADDGIRLADLLTVAKYMAPEYDAFICHASEDKPRFVEPLAEELDGKGLEIWYDEFELLVGDSLRGSINRGLSNSNFGIVVLSKNFFNKDWTERELNGLAAKEIEGECIILPIWLDVTKDDVLNHSPMLADKLAIQADTGEISGTAERIHSAIKAHRERRVDPGNQVRRIINDVLDN